VSVAAGLALAVAAACLIGAAGVMQVPAARSAPEALGLRPGLLLSLSRSPLWLLGCAAAVTGWLCQAAALLLAPVTLVAPAAGLSVVVVLWAAPRRLGDVVSRADRLATAGIVAGVALTAVTAPARSGSHGGPAAMALVLVPLLAAAALPHVLPGRPPAVLPIAAGAAFALCAIATKMATDALASPAGVLPWLLVAAAGAAAGGIAQMTALRSLAASGVVAVVFAVETLVPLLAAPVLFGESWSALPGGRRAALAAGIALVLAGVAAAARSPQIAAVSYSPAAAPTPAGQDTPVPPRPQ
jgi:hypothetical protein